MNSKQKIKFFSIEPFFRFERNDGFVCQNILRRHEKESCKKLWTLQDSWKMTEILQESCKMTQKICHEIYHVNAFTCKILKEFLPESCKICAFSQPGSNYIGKKCHPLLVMIKFLPETLPKWKLWGNIFVLRTYRNCRKASTFSLNCLSEKN